MFEPAGIVILLTWIVTIAYVVMNASGRKLVSFPFIYMGTWAGFILPRLLDLQTTDHPFAAMFQDNGTVLIMAVFSVFCIAAGLIGYRITAPVNKAFPNYNITRDEERRIMWGGVILLCIALVGLVYLAALGGGLSSFYSGSSYKLTWEGEAVYFHFAMQFIYISLIAFCFLYYKTKRAIYLLLIGVSIIKPISDVFLLYRRSDTLILGVIAAYALMAWGGKRLGRSHAAIGFAVLASVVIVFPVLRTNLNTEIKKDSAQIYAESLEHQTFGYGSEIASAAYNFHQIRELAKYQNGAIVWNALVGQFVPRGLVGREFKDSLYMRSSSEENYIPGFSNRVQYYLSPMGFTQAFQQFGYIGFIVFTLFGMIVGKMESLSHRSFRHQLLFVTMLPFFVTGVSNDISIIFPRLIYFGLVCFLFFPSLTPALSSIAPRTRRTMPSHALAGVH